MPYPVSKSALGIAKETTPGTPVAAVDWLPVTAMTPDEQITALLDQAWRASAAKTYGAQQGIKAVAYDLGGNLHPDVVGYVVAGLLGDSTVTGSGPYTHARSLLNSGTMQPSTYTLTDTNGLDASTYAGCRFSECTFTWAADGFVTWAAKVAGLAQASTSLPSATYTTVTPMTAWRGVTTVAGGPVSTHADGEIAIKRTVDQIATVQNSQTPFTQFAAGDLEVTGKATIVYEAAGVDASVLRTKFQAGTVTSWDVAWSQAAGANGLTLHSSQVWLTKANVVRGKSYIELDVEWEGLANTSDAGASGGMSPVKATIVSAKPGGTYS